MRVLVTGASRGIGAAVARAFAAHHGVEARVALLGRSLSQPSHPETPGTLLETQRAVESHGACGIPVAVDARDPRALQTAVREVVESMGGLDVLVNNASALYLAPTLLVKHMDLLYQVNTRATMLCTETCLPYLAEGDAGDGRGAVVTLSPPVRVGRLDWITPHPAYTLSKYSMTLSTLSAASERVRANCLWPRYTVRTSATRRLELHAGADGAYSRGRDPSDVALAVHLLATARPSTNGAAVYDDEVVPLPTTTAPLDLFATECVDSLRHD